MVTKFRTGCKQSQKTEICAFNIRDVTPVTIKIWSDKVKSENKISVLGMIFDSKLQWSKQVFHIMCVIRLISRYFSTKELVQLLTSNYYSFYCTVVRCGI
jgi:hypothetical protein